MKRTFNIAVNLTKNAYSEFELHPPINLVSGDYGTNVLKFTVYEDGVPVDLTGTIGKLTCKCPSGTHQQQDLTMSSPKEGKMEAILEQRFFAEGGTYLVEVQLYNASDLKVRATLPRFTYNVDLSLLEDKAVIASEQYSILQQMIDNVANAEATSIEALETATRAMNIANQKGDKATIEADRAKSEADRAKTEADRAWSADFSKHVTLDGDKQQNFDFIKNQVVQDGLIRSEYDINMNRKDTNPYYGYYIAYKYNELKDVNAFYVDFNGLTSGTCLYIESPDSALSTAIRLDTLLKNGFFVVIIIDKLNNTICIKYENGMTKKMAFTADCVITFFGNSAGNYGCYGRVKSFLYYSMELSQKEIQNNLSAINNSPSIKELRTTDSTGKTSILNFASSEDFVEMASGRTLREEYMGVLKPMGKEFVSESGAPIKVPNGIEARIISGSIKGQTVKNVNNLVWTKTTTHVIAMMRDVADGSKYTIYNNSNGIYKLAVLQNTEYLTPNKSYTTDSRFEITTKGSNTVEFYFKRVDGQNITNEDVRFANDYIICEGVVPQLTMQPIPFGLSSTQAIISNNGQQYPIYEPTIQGKTRILKALKGTQNWVEIQNDEVRDTVAYDYKLESVGGDLGSTPSETDYVDRARKVKVINTKEIVLDGTEKFILHTTGNYAQSFYTDVTVELALKNQSAITVVCNEFASRKGVYSIDMVNSCAINENAVLLFSTDKNTISTVAQLKTYLTQQKENGTPITVRYQLATPIEVPLTAEELKAYEGYKKVILCNGISGVYDTLEILEDGSGVYTQNSKFANLAKCTFGIKDTLTNTTRLRIVFEGGKNNSDCICSHFKSNVSLGLDEEHSYVDTGGAWIFIDNNKLTNMTAEEWVIENEPHMVYKLATPITTHIPKELVPTIRTHKTNILDVGGAVQPSGFKVKVPVDKISDIESRLQALESTTVDIVLNKK